MRSLKTFLIVGAVLAAVVLIFQGARTVRSSIFEQGYTRAADSVGHVAELAKTAAVAHTKDSVLTAVALLERAHVDSQRSLVRDVSALNDRVAALRQRALPAVAVTSPARSAGTADSNIVSLRLSDSVYAVARPVGDWVQLADQKLAQDDSVISDQSVVINVRFPRLLAQRDTQTALLRTALAASDSLASFHATDAVYWQRRYESMRPSAVDKAGHVVLYALAIVGAVEGTRRALGH